MILGVQDPSSSPLRLLKIVEAMKYQSFLYLISSLVAPLHMNRSVKVNEQDYLHFMVARKCPLSIKAVVDKSWD